MVLEFQDRNHVDIPSVAIFILSHASNRFVKNLILETSGLKERMECVLSKEETIL